MKDKFDAMGEAYDNKMKQATEDGIPLWMIQERLDVQKQEYEQRPILKRFKRVLKTWYIKVLIKLR